MSDSEEKKKLRGTIKAPPELVSRIQDETRRLRKKLGLTQDPAAWTVVTAALDLYDKSQQEGEGSREASLREEEREMVAAFLRFLHEHGPGTLPRKNLLRRLGIVDSDKSSRLKKEHQK